jgi:D-alanyl-D-alanine carboxypeptidase
MKQFLYMIFGGISAVACGIAIFFAGQKLWSFAKPSIVEFKMPSIASVADAVITQPSDGTTISGLKRTVRYSASEEEGLMTAVTLSLPAGSVKDVSATGYIVEDLNTGYIVAKSNEDKLLPIASLTKLVTAVVAKKLIKDDERITITREVTNIYGNTAQFRIGETFRAEDLYYPLLMVSSNDAAEAFARKYGRAKFMLAMNDFVQSIGAYRTSFSDASGLSPDNVSTARDLVIILNWVRQHNPELISITQTKTKTVRSHTWINPTHFLSWSTFRGGKNGYTDEANRTAAALFEMGDKKDLYAVVILGSAVRDDDIIKLLGKVK